MKESLKLDKNLTAVVCILFGAFLASALAFSPYTMDDSFITFRYGCNLAHGLGLRWNAGEAPVEGYTSVLWVWISAVLCWLGLDLVITSKLIGIAAILALTGIFWKLLKREAIFTAPLFLVFLFGSADTAANAITGMETALAALLLSAFFVAVIQDAVPLILALFALLCGLVRPEFNLVVSVVLIVQFLAVKKPRRWLLETFVPYLLLGGVYFLIRWAYFGLPFPLPFYIKQVGAEKMQGVIPVIKYCFFVLPLLVSALTSGRRYLPVLAGIGSLLIYYLYPLHLMGDYNRFLFPAFPALCALAAVTIGRYRVAMRFAVPLLALVFHLPIFYGNITYAQEYAAGLSRAHVPLGMALAELPPGTLAISDAGAVPFYSGWKTIDMFGLNDKRIALDPKTDRAAAYIMDHQPDVLVLISASPTQYESGERTLEIEGQVNQIAQRMEYRIVDTLTFKDNWHLLVMVSPSYNSRLFLYNIP